MATNYSTLVQDIQDWTENDATEFTDNIDRIIALAEERIAKEVDSRNHPMFRKSTTLALTSGDYQVAVPADYLRARWARIENGDFLLRKDESFIYEINPTPTTTGTLRYYAEETDATNFVFAPAAAASINVLLSYVYRPDGLSSSNTTTFLATDAEDLLLYACLLEATAFMQVDELDYNRWSAMYDRALQTFIAGQVDKRQSDAYRKGERVETTKDSGV